MPFGDPAAKFFGLADEYPDRDFRDHLPSVRDKFYPVKTLTGPSNSERPHDVPPPTPAPP
jgi:hypothetical protein